jgi:hypothetical protein
MASEADIIANVNRFISNLGHPPSDKELEALINASATIIGYEREGWIEKISANKTVAIFKLHRLPTDELMKNFVRMLCAKYRLNESLYSAVQQGRFAIRQEGDHHILEIGDHSLSEKICVGHCQSCGKELKVKKKGLRPKMHLTCACGVRTDIEMEQASTEKQGKRWWEFWK